MRRLIGLYMNHRVSDVILLTIAVKPGGLTSSGEDQTQLRQDIEEVLVWGRASDQKGLGKSGSEGLVGDAAFTTRVFPPVDPLSMRFSVRIPF